VVIHDDKSFVTNGCLYSGYAVFKCLMMQDSCLNTFQIVPKEGKEAPEIRFRVAAMSNTRVDAVLLLCQPVVKN